MVLGSYEEWSPPTRVSSSRKLLQLGHLLHLLPLPVSALRSDGFAGHQQIFDAPQTSHLAQELLEKETLPLTKLASPRSSPTLHTAWDCFPVLGGAAACCSNLLETNANNPKVFKGSGSFGPGPVSCGLEG